MTPPHRPQKSPRAPASPGSSPAPASPSSPVGPAAPRSAQSAALTGFSESVPPPAAAGTPEFPALFTGEWAGMEELKELAKLRPEIERASRRSMMKARARSVIQGPPPREPEPVPPSHLGVERTMMPDPAWLALLHERSNFDFAAFPTINHEDLVVTDWLQHHEKLAAAGWGTALTFTGFNDAQTVSGKNPRGAGEEEKLLHTGIADALDPSYWGVLHALMARLMLKDTGLDGAVVFLVNQNLPQDGFVFSSRYLQYSDAFFAALTFREPAPDLPVFRAGLRVSSNHRQKSGPSLAEQLIEEWPEMFVWQVEHSQFSEPLPDQGLHDSMLRIHIDREKHRSRIGVGCTRLDVNGAGVVAWFRALGRQFAAMPAAVLPPPRRAGIAGQSTWPPGLRAEKNWNFDGALVRDPSWPAAEPRLTALPLPHDGIVRGRTAGRSDLPPHAIVDIILGSGAIECPVTDEGSRIPAAGSPLASIGGNRMFLFTFDTQGDLCFWRIRRIPDSFTVIPSLEPLPAPENGVRPRRLKELAVCSDDNKKDWVFYAGADALLYASVCADGENWSVPFAVPFQPEPDTANPEAVRLHPFSKLSARWRQKPGKAEADILIQFTNEGAERTSVRLELVPGIPDFLETQGAPNPAGSAMASWGHHRAAIFGFIGTDLLLSTGGRDSDGDRISFKPAGEDGDLLHPHSGLAVGAEPGGIVFAAITDTGDLALYHFEDIGGWWRMTSDREVIPPPGGGPGPGKLEQAYGPPLGWMRAAVWHLNPYSDLSIAHVDGEPAVFTAATSVTGPGLLRWRRSDGWQICLL